MQSAQLSSVSSVYFVFINLIDPRFACKYKWEIIFCERLLNILCRAEEPHFNMNTNIP